MMLYQICLMTFGSISYIDCICAFQEPGHVLKLFNLSAEDTNHKFVVVLRSRRYCLRGYWLPKIRRDL